MRDCEPICAGAGGPLNLPAPGRCSIRSNDHVHSGIGETYWCPCERPPRQHPARTWKNWTASARTNGLAYLFCRNRLARSCSSGLTASRLSRLSKRASPFVKSSRLPRSAGVLQLPAYGRRGVRRRARGTRRHSDDINTGINTGRCACGLRNPQSSCCLGSVRRLITRLQTQAVATA